jgi:hypothetical protein
MMGTETVPETLDFNELTRLLAREKFINICVYVSTYRPTHVFVVSAEGLDMFRLGAVTTARKMNTSGNLSLRNNFRWMDVWQLNPGRWGHFGRRSLRSGGGENHFGWGPPWLREADRTPFFDYTVICLTTEEDTENFFHDTIFKNSVYASKKTENFNIAYFNF